MTWAGVVLDVDDTLYLERDYVRSGFAAVGRFVSEQHGIEGFSEIAWRLFEDGRRGDTFDAALEALDQPTGQIPVPELVDVYRAHDPTIELLADSRAFVDRLVAARIPVGIITDGPTASQHAKINALGVADVAEVVVVTADLGPGLGKPHEASYLRVQDALGMDGADLVYVADNPTKDFIAPRDLGWDTVRVRRPGSLHERVHSGDDVAMEVRDLHGLDVS